MKLKNIVNKTLDKFLNEQVSTSSVKLALSKLDVTNYEILGEGQHGIAVLNKDNRSVIKFTQSNNEFEIVKKIHQTPLKTLPKIYKFGEVENMLYYIRDYYYPIPDDLAERIGEENEDLNDFFYYKVNDVRKSETNLTYAFDDKFLDFLNDLKRDLKKIGVAQDFDIDGLSLNTYMDRNGEYILVDF